MKTTVLTFDQAGGIKADATGFVGKACQETTDKLLAGLGAAVKKEERKPEMLRTASTGSGLGQTIPNRW